MYEEFANVYDRLMRDFDYRAWAEYYLSILRIVGCAPTTIAELGCGTGSMAIELAKRDIAVTGLDISEAMLGKAAEKARQAGVSVALVKQDMRDFRLHKPVDAIVIPCDGLNYLLDDEALDQCLASAYRALGPSGVLAFDVSTEYKLSRMHGELYYEDRADLTYFWENRWTAPYIDMSLTFFVRGHGGAYRRFDERQRQRAYAPDRLDDALARAGFAQTWRWGDRVLDAPDARALRVHMAATKRRMA